MGCMEKGTSPSGLGCHTPLGPMRLGMGGNPKGGAPLLGGQAPLPLVAAPPSRSHLEGAGGQGKGACPPKQGGRPS